MQNWYSPHPYGVYPRGNATDRRDINERLGQFSSLIHATTDDDTEKTELPFIELVQTILSYVEVPDLCRLSRTCTGFYVLVHCTDAFKNTYTLLSPARLRFRHSWKETAVRGYLRSEGRLSAADDDAPELPATAGDGDLSPATKKARSSANGSSNGNSSSGPRYPHTPVMVARRFYCDQLFQAWMCTLLPTHYHLRPADAPAKEVEVEPSPEVGHSIDASGNDVLQLRCPGKKGAAAAAAETNAAGPSKAGGRKTPRTPAAESAGTAESSDDQGAAAPPPQYTSAFKPVPRCEGLSAEEFRTRFEKPNLPVILTGIATEWPMYKIFNGRFANLADKRRELVRPGCSEYALLRCEHTDMSLADYVRYATEQTDERPIYMFDAEFWRVLETERLYTVPEHFACDDFFRAMGDTRRPKHRWIIAGPKRGGSSFHVDPNYTNAWNANLTGRKRWLLFPPGATPPGCVPSTDMSEVATPLSLTEWLLNFYDASVQQLRTVGYECICEPGEIMFIPCGWWHSVVNLEDSVAITHNYVSSSNLANVVKFLRAMKGSISGINEDSDDVSEMTTEMRRQRFADEFVAAMHAKFPSAMNEAEEQLAREQEERERKRMGNITMLEVGSDGFMFDF